MGSLLGYLTAEGKPFLLCESGTVVPLLTEASLPCWRRHAPHICLGGGGRRTHTSMLASQWSHCLTPAETCSSFNSCSCFLGGTSTLIKDRSRDAIPAAAGPPVKNKTSSSPANTWNERPILGTQTFFCPHTPTTLSPPPRPAGQTLIITLYPALRCRSLQLSPCCQPCLVLPSPQRCCASARQTTRWVRLPESRWSVCPSGSPSDQPLRRFRGGFWEQGVVGHVDEVPDGCRTPAVNALMWRAPVPPVSVNVFLWRVPVLPVSVKVSLWNQRNWLSE